jgi:hypothetical protein
MIQVRFVKAGFSKLEILENGVARTRFAGESITL